MPDAQSLWLWRGIAAVGLLGWGITAVVLWPEAEPVPMQVAAAGEAGMDAVAPHRGKRPERITRFGGEGRGRRGPRGAPEGMGPGAGRQLPMGGPSVASGDDIPEEVMEKARQEVREEWRARRERMSEERLDDALIATADFVEANGLDEEAHVALEKALTENHERMAQLFSEHREADHDDPAVRDARREKFQQSFQKMQQEVESAVGEDLAVDFMEDLRGGRGWGPPGGRPPGPPPGAR